MHHFAHMPPVEWAERVNRSWIVHSNLDDQAEAWMHYLRDLNDGRLELSCQIARTMCDLRDSLDDPKPWFYSGLFHLAMADEARRFLANHPVTKATVPAMAEDENVLRWREHISPATYELLERLRVALLQARESEALD
jgi:hypothetical protein